MAYYVGDIPAEPVIVEPTRGGDPIDLDGFTAAETETTLIGPDGEVVDADFAVTFDDETASLVIDWPGSSPFGDPGLYTLRLTLVGTGVRERLAPVYFVAQDDSTGWYTVDTAREDWALGEATTSDARLHQLLELAKQQVLAFAPALAEDAAIPVHYRAAQLAQAQNLYNAGVVDPATGDAGTDGFALRPYPLDWMIQQMLRPKHGTPVVA